MNLEDNLKILHFQVKSVKTKKQSMAAMQIVRWHNIPMAQIMQQQGFTS